MLRGQRLYIFSLFLFLSVVLCTPLFAKKSVYVISDTGNTVTDIPIIQAYEIQGTSLSLKTEYGCMHPLAIGVTIDESESGQFLFVTHEGYEQNPGDEIEIVNAKTMQYVDMVIAPGATNLAGIAMDVGKSKLYAVDRFTNNLYSWSWDRISKRLTPDFDEPYYIELTGISNLSGKGAFGIALDEEHSRLYVADNTNAIKYYSTANWSDPQPLLGQIPASCNVISVALDVPNQLLYYGSMGTYGQGDPKLYKYNISTQTQSSVVIGSGNWVSAAGIAVDQETSLVYITVYGGPFDTYYANPPQDRLMIYNSSLAKQSFESGDIGNPAGVAVAANVGYKEPLFSIIKDSNVPDSNCVVAGQHITFDIEWDANGHSDTNAFVIDYLPTDLEFLFSEPDADDYNSISNTLKWYLPDFNEDSSVTLK